MSDVNFEADVAVRLRVKLDSTSPAADREKADEAEAALAELHRNRAPRADVERARAAHARAEKRLLDGRAAVAKAAEKDLRARFADLGSVVVRRGGVESVEIEVVEVVVEEVRET